MRSIRSPRQAPVVVLAGLALVAALAGTALAGPDAMTSSLKKSKVKAIAKKQADKRITNRAPGLSVAEAAALGGLPAAAYARVESEPWRDVGTAGQPDFENTWAIWAGLGKVSFYKDPIGIVRLRGSVISNGSSTEQVIFTLPPGYRPEQGFTVLAAKPDAATTARAGVGSEGEVLGLCTPQNGCTVRLDGIAFRAD
jgi:hypothetical protein